MTPSLFCELAAIDHIGSRLLRSEPALVLASDGERIVWANGAMAHALGAAEAADLERLSDHIPQRSLRQIRSVSTTVSAGSGRPVVLRRDDKLAAFGLRAKRTELADGQQVVLLFSARQSDAPEDVADDSLSSLGPVEAMIVDADGIERARSEAWTASLPPEELSDPIAEVERSARSTVETVSHSLGRVLMATRLAAAKPFYLVQLLGPAAQVSDPVSAGAPEPAAATAGDETATNDALASALPPADHDRDHEHVHDGQPLRFIFKVDAERRLQSISPHFGELIGADLSDYLDRPFTDLLAAFALDPEGSLRRKIEGDQMWSGHRVRWPDDAGMAIETDLAALPTFDRDRVFTGFRGFGIAHLPKPAAVVTDAAEDRPPAMSRRGLTEEEQRNLDDIARTLRGSESAAEPEAKAAAEPTTEPSAPPARLREMPFSDDSVRSLLEQSRWDRGTTRRERSSRIGRQARTEDRSDQRSEEHEQNSAGDAETPMPALGSPEAGELWATAVDPASFPEEEHDGDGVADHEEAEASPAADAADDEAVSERSRDDAPTSGDAPNDAFHANSAETGERAIDADGLSALPPDDPAAEAPETAEPSPDPLRPRSGRLYLTPAALARMQVASLVVRGETIAYASEPFLALSGYGSVGAIEEAGGFETLLVEPVERSSSGDRAQALRLNRADGQTTPVRVTVQSIGWRDGTALLFALRPDEAADIGERATDEGRDEASSPMSAESTEERDLLLQTVSELTTILDTATDGIVLVDPVGCIRSLNRSAEALFGYDSDEMQGEPFTGLFAYESQRTAAQYLACLSKGGMASVLNDGREVIGREAEGGFLPLFLSIGRLPEQGGFCAIIRDITASKRAEEQLRQARERAENASSQKSDFLARISHEVRTPLNAIIGFCELMIEERFGPVGSPRYRDYLRDIKRSGTLVLDLVNDLLDISRIEAGQQNMQFEAVSLNDIVAEAIPILQPRANSERVIVRTSLVSDIPEIVADPRSMRQVVLNLLTNAVKYTQSGGQVIISTSRGMAGSVVLRFRDTGIGMNEDEIEEAMKPFRQLERIRKVRDGTGLGLPLTKAMVEANRAEFAIRSEPDRGTRVEITFPSSRVLES